MQQQQLQIDENKNNKNNTQQQLQITDNFDETTNKRKNKHKHIDDVLTKKYNNRNKQSKSWRRKKMKKFLFLGIVFLNHAMLDDEFLDTRKEAKEKYNISDEEFDKIVNRVMKYRRVKVNDEILLEGLEEGDVPDRDIYDWYQLYINDFNSENQQKLLMEYEIRKRNDIYQEWYSILCGFRNKRNESWESIKEREFCADLIKDAFNLMKEAKIQDAKSANFHAREKAIASQCQVNIFNFGPLSELSDEELEKVTGHKIPRIIPDEEDIHIPQQSDASIKRDKIYDSKVENFLARERAISLQYGKANFDYSQLSKLSDEELEKATGHKIPRIIPDDEPVKVNLGLPQKSDAASNDQLQLTMLEDETLHNYQQIHHSEPLHNRTSTPWWTMAIGCVIFVGSAVGITSFVALKNKKKNEVKFDEQDFYDQNKTIKN